jgi:hypothetical protein
MEIYIDFQDFIIDFQNWYCNKWVGVEWDFMERAERRKYNNSLNEFSQEMVRRIGVAIERSRSDFGNKVYTDDNFSNEIKSLMEQLNVSEKTYTLTVWAGLLDENGYSLTKYGYNNIERLCYELLFFINGCMFLDQEFPDNNISDSIIEKMKINLNEIRRSNR